MKKLQNTDQSIDSLESESQLFHDCYEEEKGQQVNNNKILQTNSMDQFKDKIECGICFEIVTEEMKPIECENCHNKIYCTQCFQNWIKQNQTCPYCKQRSVGVSPGPFIMGVIKSMKYPCKFKPQGCNYYLTKGEILKHEASCKYGLKLRKYLEHQRCQFCNVQMKKKQYHICKKEDEDNLCQNHLKATYQLNNDRIANLKEVQNQEISFTCLICQKILCKPVYCNHCMKSFCQVCIVNKLSEKNYCPSCSQPDPELKEIQRNDLSLFVIIKVKCKNYDKGCGEIISYVDLKDHEEKCYQCDKCKFNYKNQQKDQRRNPANTHKVLHLKREPQNAIQNQPLLPINNQRENDRHGKYFQRVYYCMKNYISKTERRIVIDIPIIIIDFLFQNAMLASEIYQFVEGKFITDDQSNIFITVSIIYYLSMIVPFAYILLTDKYSEYNDHRQWTKLGKTLLLISTLFCGNYFYIAFCPLFVRQLSQRLVSYLKPTTKWRLLSVLIQVVVVIVLFGNDDTQVFLVTQILMFTSFVVNLVFLNQFATENQN